MVPVSMQKEAEGNSGAADRLENRDPPPQIANRSSLETIATLV